MIRTIDIRLNAAHPELPLPEATTYQGAPSTAFLRGVPKACGQWQITAVSVAVTFPDGSTTTRAAVLSAGDVWVATIPACATSGRTVSGLRILADGTDENGDAVTGYVLGVADFAVATFDIAPAPGVTSYALRYFDNVPNPPHKGDVAKIGGVLKYYDGTAWHVFADVDLSNYAKKADATLTARTGFSEWEYGALTVSGADWFWTYVQPTYSNGVWTAEITNGPDFVTMTAQGGEDATSLTFVSASGAAVTVSGSATRTALKGYQLGSQEDMPLASEEDMEAAEAAIAQRAEKPTTAPTNGNFAGWDASGKLTDSGKKPSDFLPLATGGTINASVTAKGSITADNLETNAGGAVALTSETGGPLIEMTRYDGHKWTIGYGWILLPGNVVINLPSVAGTLALVSQLPASETWTFEVDDGQGGTTTVTKNVAIYAAGGNS